VINCCIEWGIEITNLEKWLRKYIYDDVVKPCKFRGPLPMNRPISRLAIIMTMYSTTLNENLSSLDQTNG
jgi:hypothetical protein